MILSRERSISNFLGSNFFGSIVPADARPTALKNRLGRNGHSPIPMMLFTAGSSFASVRPNATPRFHLTWGETFQATAGTI